MGDTLQYELRFKESEFSVEVTAFITLLQNRDWITAAEILDHSVAEIHHWTDRRLRKLAEHSEGRIISGQNGYKLTRLATRDECAMCINTLNSQAAKMKHRALQIQLAAASI